MSRRLECLGVGRVEVEVDLARPRLDPVYEPEQGAELRAERIEGLFALLTRV